MRKRAESQNERYTQLLLLLPLRILALWWEGQQIGNHGYRTVDTRALEEEILKCPDLISDWCVVTQGGSEGAMVCSREGERGDGGMIVEWEEG